MLKNVEQADINAMCCISMLCVTDRGQCAPAAKGLSAVNLGSDTATPSPWTPEMLCHKFGGAWY